MSGAWNYLKSFRHKFSSAAHANFYDKYAKASASERSASIIGISVNSNLKLSDIIKIEKLECLSPHTIADIWHKHFERRPLMTSLSIGEALFSLWWHHRAQESPTFIIPLKVGEGVCNFMVQHSVHNTGGCSIFTTLDDYQRYKEAAPIRLVTHCFGDLLQSKQIGLVRTQFDGNLISREQANSLLRTCIDFYTTNSYQWVRTFNHNPQQFTYDTFLAYFTDRMMKSKSS